MSKRMINLCMSGGRTSAYMVNELLRLQSIGYFSDVDFIITFANTGRENSKTLEFVNNCDNLWSVMYGVRVIWLEAVINDGRKPSGHKMVDFNSADREGVIFEEMVKKYGLPNGTFLHCTRELKENPIMSYMGSLGGVKGHVKNKSLVPANYETWVGIRVDEPKRLTGNINGKQRKHYPLAWGSKEVPDDHGLIVDKQDVLSFWEDMPFNLELEEHQGNCVDCHKKSNNKLAKVYLETPHVFKFTEKLDLLYSYVNPQVVDGEDLPRKRFRGYKNTGELIAGFNLNNINLKDYSEESGGCSESCEPFME